MIERTSFGKQARSTIVHNRAAAAEGEGEASNKTGGGWARVKERTKEDEAGGTHFILLKE